MADLLCLESETAPSAYIDPTLIHDRVLRNLLEVEESFLPSKSIRDFSKEDNNAGSACRNPEEIITEDDRRAVVDWMIDICGNTMRQDDVLPLAVNYLDRYFLSGAVNKKNVQTIAVGCLMIASKVREPDPFQIEDLATNTGETPSNLLELEWKICKYLDFHLCVITPHDFLIYILERLPLGDYNDKIYHAAQTFICLCIRDASFSTVPSSLIACACVIAAITQSTLTRDLPSCNCDELATTLHNIMSIDKDFLLSYHNRVQELINACREQMNKVQRVPTPVDVDDIHF